MIENFTSDTSPYLALWYLFLAFFGVVLVFQLFCLVLRAIYSWRIGRLYALQSPAATTPAAETTQQSAASSHHVQSDETEKTTAKKASKGTD